MIRLSIKSQIANWNFDEKPLLVFWETTKACGLSCKHCRAEAIREGLSGELTTEHGIELIDQVLEFGEPLPALIFTGGDLLMRADIFQLIEYATKKGLRVAVAPSVTPLLTQDILLTFKRIGVHAISISLDGAKPETHDGIRGFLGTFDSSLAVLRLASEIGLRTQVNTTVMQSNYAELADIFHLLRMLQVPAWEVFFLIRTGRGSEIEDLDSHQYEDVMHFLSEASYYGVTIRTTEGPHFRRVILNRLKGIENSRKGQLYRMLVSRLHELDGSPSSELKAQTIGTRDGRGIIFVSYDGQIFPSGFLPIGLGNVKESRLNQVYKQNRVLRILRTSSNLKGRCGRCEYGDICGGSRSRAYAYYKDPLQEDPSCIYEPKVL